MILVLMFNGMCGWVILDSYYFIIRFMFICLIEPGAPNERGWNENVRVDKMEVEPLRKGGVMEDGTPQEGGCNGGWNPPGRGM